MANISTPHYKVHPSDSRKWVIIESPSGLSIDVELKIMNYHYDCIPQQIKLGDSLIWCSQLCCYTGCYISPEEVREAESILPHISQYLQKDSKVVIAENHNQIHIPEDFDREENLYKTRCAPDEWDYDDEDSVDEENEENDSNQEEKDTTDMELEDDDDLAAELEDDQNYKEEDETASPPSNHCVFLMENGYCATHKYYVDNKINWVKKKFNICTTFPLDIRPQDKTLAFMVDFDKFTFGNVNCINSDEKFKKSLGMPQIIDSMKYVIVDRYGEEWWIALNHFAKDFRSKKITIKKIYAGEKKTN